MRGPSIFYGSKSGLRQLAQQAVRLVTGILLPEGVIGSVIYGCLKITANKIHKGVGGVVLKTNKGHSGIGVLLFKGEIYLLSFECQQKILSILQKDAYWNLFPIVVSRILRLTHLSAGMPLCRVSVLQNGHVELSFYGGMRMTPRRIVSWHGDPLTMSSLIK